MARQSWARFLLIAGLVGMLAGAIDPLEGSLLIVPSAAVAALGAFLAASRFRKWLYVGFVLLAAGAGIMFVLSALGGVGGTTGRSVWWALLLLPYPAGWIVDIVGTIRALRPQR